ncbi:protein YLS3 [Tripterygium wilfordii]|uniref:Protein YLS3 n=1 Tax=Tripterygium wilfordii TaxID=458696 RepID=A0A7J7CJ03_TRIWF|nr:non-specific lipid transfer protein GPI-anchored 11-like [Tripterygium wilfordii]KAF5734037.1 protein YLS3 [Tripterygium wilfordii]
MGAAMLFLALSMFFSMGAHLCYGDFSQTLGEAMNQAYLVQDSNGSPPSDSFPCIKKLMPCEPYLGKPTTPPASCCVPMKEMVKDEKQCLCDVFNNAAFLKSLNITQEIALQLPKACGAPVDISVCKKEGSSPPSGSPEVPTPPAPPKSSDNSSSSSSPPPSSSNKASAGYAITRNIEGHVYTVLFATLIFSAL